VIDHVSLAVADLARAARFYDSVLAALGHRRLGEAPGTIGYGKRYPELWLNARPGMAAVSAATGGHVCLRAATPEAVRAFHAAALAVGGTDDGAPGLRPEYDPRYYAAFVRDPDGNRIEAVTFLDPDAPPADRG